MKCVEAGVLTNHARDEIINSLATCIMLYTTSPTAEERRLACQHLTETHSSLKDSIGSGYVCYNKQLHVYGNVLLIGLLRKEIKR